MKKIVQPKLEACPCGSGKTLAYCCGLYHAGVAAPDAVSLMRSRYSAYALALESYLLATWHPSTRPSALGLEDESGVKWLGLEVKSSGQKQDEASVNFVARFKVNGRAGRLEEHSRFVRENGCWFYVDGKVADG